MSYTSACVQLGDVLVLRGQPGDFEQALRHYLAQPRVGRIPAEAQPGLRPSP